MIAGAITAVLLCLFIVITGWAWSRRNHARFEEASRLPLEDDFNLHVRASRNGECCCKERTP
jgi:cbb3-type cytochrome oxidase subunit 3